MYPQQENDDDSSVDVQNRSRPSSTTTGITVINTEIKRPKVKPTRQAPTRPRRHDEAGVVVHYREINVSSLLRNFSFVFRHLSLFFSAGKRSRSGVYLTRKSERRWK